MRTMYCALSLVIADDRDGRSDHQLVRGLGDLPRSRFADMNDVFP